MLTRLKVSGFKNLVDVDVRFGPFTCIAGPNAVGKSNLFDAIRFLSYLADDTLLDAALKIRSEVGKTSEIRSLFHRVGKDYAEQMSFEAEMILPEEGVDDLGQKAEATITFVRYRLVLAYREAQDLPSLGKLEITEEHLEHINIGDASKNLRFPHSFNNWRRSVVKGRRTSEFISTKVEDGNTVVKLSQDGQGGRPKTLLAERLPRTVLSNVNAIESPTVLLTKREMQSWRLLQLEPSAMREPDNFITSPGLEPDGAHLPATLYSLARQAGVNGGDSQVYDQVASRLSELIDDVYRVEIDRDQKRELLTLQVSDHDGTVYPARSLSDGTLRFLALATIDLDPATGGLICMEEPENGIHPLRIPAIIRLLQDIACDVEEPVGPDNPLRQVIINTHSPVVVSQVPEISLLVATSREMVSGDARYKVAKFGWLPGTWRAQAEPEVSPISKGELLVYLNPIGPLNDGEGKKESSSKSKRRVIDRQDIKQLGLFDFVNE